VKALRAFLFSPRYPLWLLGALAVWFGVWAINPPHPSDFILEHILTVVFVGLLAATHRRFRLSNISYTLIFIYLCLHIVGAHYTYAEVPYARWLSALGLGAGDPAGVGRNHYDRFVHFVFGLLLAYPVREVFVRIAGARGFWGYYLPLDVVMSFSMLYELLEWSVALVFAPELGQSYLGTQGDEWDAHKDMALATLGAVIAMAATACINWRLKRDFAVELADSLRVREAKPLGEVRLAEMMRKEGDASP
jgi:putative membrane protein